MSSSRFWLVIDQSLKKIIFECDVIVMAVGILSLCPRPSSYSVLFLIQEHSNLVYGRDSRTGEGQSSWQITGETEGRFIV